ncbi:hypothetical protein [Ferruginibacter profundus]
MMLRNFLLLFLLLLFSCNHNKTIPISSKDSVQPAIAKTTTDTTHSNTIDSNYLAMVKAIQENPYAAEYDTSLKGGFSISFHHNTEDQFLLYQKGQKIIDTIGNCSLGLLYKNSGYIGADFDNSFVFVQSYGSGNPDYIQLYDKETATNLIANGSAWIDVDTARQVLLYSKADVPLPSDSMSLFDAKKNTNRQYAFPKEIFDEPQRLNRIRLTNVTDKTFTIEYEFKDRQITKTKKYIR